MPITMPRDLAVEFEEAVRWYKGTPELDAFLAHLQAGHPWSQRRRPRQLLRWADRHAVPVFGVRRFVLVLNAGFACPQQWRLWRAAKIELRRTHEAIARGEEAGMIYSGGRDLLVFADSEPRRWGAPESVLQPSLHPSLAGPPPEMAPSASSPAPSSGGAGPERPRGSWLTRMRGENCYLIWTEWPKHQINQCELG